MTVSPTNCAATWRASAPNGYFAIQAYIAPSDERERRRCASMATRCVTGRGAP